MTMSTGGSAGAQRDAVPLRSLEGKVCVITGSARGAGRDAAFQMVREGAKVAILDRSDVEWKIPGTIYSVAEQIKEMGGEALPIKVDLRSPEEIEAACTQILKAWGSVDVLVNNAATFALGPIAKLPPAKWDQVMEVNVRGMFLMIQHFLPGMIEKNSGNIVNLSSPAGRAPSPGNVVYAASRAAIDMFTVGFADEVRGNNIAVNSIAPTTGINTEGFRSGLNADDPSAWNRAEPSEHFAKCVVWLSKVDSSFTGNATWSRQLAANFGICTDWCCARPGGAAADTGPLVGGAWRVWWESGYPQRGWSAQSPVSGIPPWERSAKAMFKDVPPVGSVRPAQKQ